MYYIHSIAKALSEILVLSFRYAYHLRRWALAESGAWEGPGGAGTVRLTLQPAGAGPRATITLHQSDLVAHLRAHVHVWWEKQVSTVAPEGRVCNRLFFIVQILNYSKLRIFESSHYFIM